MSSLDPSLKNAPPTTSVRAVHGLGRYGVVLSRYDESLKAFDAGRLAYVDERSAAARRFDTTARRGRDLVRVGLLIVGLGLGDRVMGETLTTIALTIVALAPAVILLALTWQEDARLRLLDVEAGRVTREMNVLAARRVWLGTTARVVPLLHRALRIHTAEDDQLNDALARLTNVERKLETRKKVKPLASPGWNLHTEFVRRCAVAALAASALNGFVFAFAQQRTAAVVSALLSSVLAGVIYVVSRRYAEKRATAVSRAAVWNKQRDLLADLDKTVRAGTERLLAVYEDHKVIIDLR